MKYGTETLIYLLISFEILLISQPHIDGAKCFVIFANFNVDNICTYVMRSSPPQKKIAIEQQ